MELGALLHDIGEVGIREGVLVLPRALTDLETLEMRRHPEIGAALLADLAPLRRAIPVVAAHHERVDGTGYPRGLRGNAIPIEARIFQIADAYDAIMSDRPHRRGRSDADARLEIGRLVGLQFDPAIHETFSRIDPEDWAGVIPQGRSA